VISRRTGSICDTATRYAARTSTKQHEQRVQAREDSPLAVEHRYDGEPEVVPYMNASPHFDDYRSAPGFGPRMPDLSRQQCPDEIDDLSGHSEVASLQVAPQASVQYTASASELADATDDKWLTSDKANLYLWLVRTDDVKICLENGGLGKSTARNRLSHTNLSGNSPAHCGGELWFRDARSIYLNGGSSRFTARSPRELDDIAAGFRAAGYGVCNFGWDEDVGAPRRTLRRGEIQWL